jgi:hypothetical protein
VWLYEDYPSGDLPGLWSFSSAPSVTRRAPLSVASRWGDSFDEFGSEKM